MKLSKYLLGLMLLTSIFACDKKEEEVEPEIEKPVFIIDDATNITTSSADFSGSVTGNNIIETGFVYSRSSLLNESSSRLILGVGAGDLSATLSFLEHNTTYYYAVYAIVDSANFYKSSVKSFKTEEIEELKLGDIYQGGIIYYLDFSKEHGLLASPKDITMGTNWQTAMDDCYDYVLEGNDKWRLPDLDELEDLYTARNIIGGFSNIAYWSSSIEGSNHALAYGVFFGSGANAGKSFVYDKTNSYQHSRAIRDF